MRIGVVSDTHLLGNDPKLPQTLIQGLQGVDLILHAGDFLSHSVADKLLELAPLEGVAGNNDGPEILERFGKIKRIRAGSIEIGLVHGDGAGKTTERRAYDAFAGEWPDVIVFGHSHVPYQVQKDGILLFNPGSPTDKRRQPRYSYGLLHVKGRDVVAEHHYF